MHNKNTEPDIGIQAEDLKSKATKPSENSYPYLGWDVPVLSEAGD